MAGLPGASEDKQRGQGFRGKLAECGIDLIAPAAANWSPSEIEGRQIMEGWLKESTDVQGVFAHNDEMALGAIKAIQEAGLKPAIDIKIVSIGGSRDGLYSLVEGRMNTIVEHNPLIGPQVYEAALRALNGETLPAWIKIDEEIYRAEDEDLEQIIIERYPEL